MFKYLVKICVNILFKDLDLALFFILDIKTEKIINQIVKVKYISQKLLLKRFNSFIAADSRFGLRYGSYV